MNKRIRKLLFTAAAVVMAVIMASLSSVQVFAAGRNRDRSTEGKIAFGKTYVKDVIIVTESEACKLDGTAYGDYEVLTTPISDFGGKVHENLFFAVLTTEDPNEAITDIKAMNMNGDYDFDAYGDCLSAVEAWAQAKADTTMTAVREFKANYKAGKPGALFAYNMLNYLVGDNEDVPLGEFFVNDEYTAVLGIQVKNLVMKSNLMMLTYVRQLLLVACSDTKETTFAEELLKHDKNNPLINDSANNQYRTAAEDFICSMGAAGRMINAYRDALAKHGDGLDAYLEKRTSELTVILNDNDTPYDRYKAADEEYDSLKDITAGNILSGMFGGVYYLDSSGMTLSLIDILTKDPNAEKETDRPTLDMVMPIVALMSEGQRGLAGCGFDKLVGSVINDYSGGNSGHENVPDEILSMWDTISEDEPVSVYSGVDLSLYDPNGIAMVGKSGEFLKNGMDSDDIFLDIPTYAAGLMAGGGVVGIVGAVVGLKNNVPIVKDVLNQRSVIAYNESCIKTYQECIKGFNDGSAFSEKQVEVATKYISTANDEITAAQQKLAALNPRFGTAVAKVAFSSFMLVLSVALLVFSIVTIIMNVIHEDTPQDYMQVPRILVNGIEKEEYDERQQKVTKTQMIFYKGIIDPFMSDAKAEENKTPGKVMDVFDWSLTNKDREWVALYTTKDGRVGHPIIYDGADNTLIVLRQENGLSYAALEQRRGFNGRVNIFSKEDYTECGDGIIVFNSDLNASSETKTGLGSSMIINDGQLILFILLAATVGVGIGVGAYLLVGNIRGKKESEAKTA